MNHLACCLRQHFIQRRVAAGVHEALFAQPLLQGPAEEDLIELMTAMALWIDFDFVLRDAVEAAVKKWPAAARGAISYRHALLLRFAEATVAMHNEQFGAAIAGFSEVMAAQETLADQHLHVIATFATSRCYYYGDQYAEADRLAAAAHDAADKLAGGLYHAATVDILRSRILLKAQAPGTALAGARALLEKSRETFETTDDNINKGNILTFLAQIAKLEANPKAALALLESAISEFSSRPSQVGHPGEARARLYCARLLREQARGSKEEADRQVALGAEEKALSTFIDLEPRLMKALSAGQPDITLPGAVRMALHQARQAVDKLAGRTTVPAPVRKREIHEAQESALRLLDTAGQVYKRLKHPCGCGNCCICTSYIALDQGAYDRAAAMADEAYRFGQEAANHKVQARAAIVHAVVESALFEEGVEDGVRPAEHARRALESALTAIQHAEHAEPRLLGRAYVWAGLAHLLASPGAEGRRQAEGYCDKAREIARKFPGGSLNRELAVLRSRLHPGGEAAAALIEWIGTRTGKSYAELERYITQLVWADTQNVRRFQQAQGLRSHHAARGMLERAGILDRATCRK